MCIGFAPRCIPLHIMIWNKEYDGRRLETCNTVGGAVEGDIPTITHADGITILDEYFPKSSINSSPLSPVVWSHAPTASTVLQVLAQMLSPQNPQAFLILTKP
jgi:hypothetical protein